MEKISEFEAMNKIESGKLFFLFVSSNNCKSCAMMRPIVERQAGVAGVHFSEIKAEDAPELTGRLNIQGVPTWVAFHKGAVISAQVGSATPDKVSEWIDDVKDRVC